MTSAACTTYVVPWSGQLGKGGGKTGPVDCTAWSGRVVIGARRAAGSCRPGAPSACCPRSPSPTPLARPEPAPGRRRVDRALRGLPRRPHRLPGPDVGRVRAPAQGRRADDRPGRLRTGGGQPVRRRARIPGAHAMAETHHATYDSLADGRARGVWKHDGRLYTRSVMRKAAGQLVTVRDAKGRARATVGDGKVWCAIGRDTAPDFGRASSRSGAARSSASRSTTWRTGSSGAPPPRAPAGSRRPAPRPVSSGSPRRTRTSGASSRSTSGPRAGQWINAKWSHER